MKKILIIMTILSITGVASANMLVNGDFSTTDATGWTTWNGQAVTNQDNFGGPLPLICPGDTPYANWAGKAWGIWGGPWSNSGFFQSFAVNPGVSFTLSGLVMHLSSDAMTDDTFAVIKLVFKDAGGGELAGTADVIQVDPTSLTDTWISGSYTAVSPVGVATVEALLIHFQPSGIGGGAAWFDKVNLIPEPTTIALLALGGLLLRRKRK